MSEMQAMAECAARVGRDLMTLSAETKNEALEAMAAGLERESAVIQEANAQDMVGARATGHSTALLDRLKLDQDRIASMADGLRQVARLADPVGQIAEQWSRPNGLRVQRHRVPLGVVAMIYEARPNVTADAAALCLKSGNAVILRGGSEALHTNKAITEILRAACRDVGLPHDAVQLVSNTSHALVDELLDLDAHIDLVIPRGGAGLIRKVVERSRIPVLRHERGVCHLYVDDEADLSMAQQIALNSKIERPSVCNALETLLVDERVADAFLPRMIEQLKNNRVLVRGCEDTRAIVDDVEPASEADWGAEYLDLVLSVKVVPDMPSAMAHIAEHGTKHTEAIVTDNGTRAQAFTRGVDASVVLHNASTRFNDGAELGLGAEIGISTSKLHAYGPMALKELTTLKYVALGDGQVRG